MRTITKTVLATTMAIAGTVGLMGNALAETKITMTAGDTVITATLGDNPTARDFIASLPLTMKMTRWGEREYYGKVAKPLSGDASRQNGFKNGDVAYWVPGGSFAVFFDDTGNTIISDLIVMGTVTSDLAAFDMLSESVDLRIDISADK